MTPEIKQTDINKQWNVIKYLITAARRVWRWSPERRAILDESEIKAYEPNKPPKVRLKRFCFSCKKRFNKKDVQADHIKPVGIAPKSFKGWDDYYISLFCSRDNLQPLCKECHKKKTKIDVKGMRDNA